MGKEKPVGTYPYAGHTLKEVLRRLVTNEPIQERMIRAFGEITVAPKEDFDVEDYEEREKLVAEYRRLRQNIDMPVVDHYDRLVDYDTAMATLADHVVYFAARVLEKAAITRKMISDNQ